MRAVEDAPLLIGPIAFNGSFEYARVTDIRETDNDCCVWGQCSLEATQQGFRVAQVFKDVSCDEAVELPFLKLRLKVEAFAVADNDSVESGGGEGRYLGDELDACDMALLTLLE